MWGSGPPSSILSRSSLRGLRCRCSMRCVKRAGHLMCPASMRPYQHVRRVCGGRKRCRCSVGCVGRISALVSSASVQPSRRVGRRRSGRKRCHCSMSCVRRVCRLMSSASVRPSRRVTRMRSGSKRCHCSVRRMSRACRLISVMICNVRFWTIAAATAVTVSTMASTAMRVSSMSTTSTASTATTSITTVATNSISTTPTISTATTTTTLKVCETLPEFTYPSHFPYVQLQAKLKNESILLDDIPHSDVGFFHLFTKLALGQDILILVLGGSVPAGHGCKDPSGLSGKECAWPALLANWFQQFSSHVQVKNLAVPGTTSKMSLGLLAAYHAQYPAADAIIIDYLVNDAVDAGSWHYFPIPGMAQTGSSDTAPSIVYEMLLRAISEVFTQVAIVSFEAGCQICATWSSSHLLVLAHYHILAVDYNRISSLRSEFWDPPNQLHPMWYSHVYMADVIVSGIRQKLQKVCASQSASLDKLAGIHEVSPYNSPKALNKLSFCKKTSTFYDSYSSESSDLELIQSDGFALFEDRPGKPGWISTTPKSRIMFQISFGKQPTFCIAYLRSYEGMSNATLRVKGSKCEIILQGLWSKKASQLDMACFLAYQPFQFKREIVGEQLECNFNQTPGTHTSVSLEHDGSLGQKFKVTSVMSC